MLGRIALTLGLVSLYTTHAAQATEPPPRLVVLTDVNSLTTGAGEPDDGQSLVRLMLHSNEFAIEGLVASSRMRHGRKTRPDRLPAGDRRL